MSPAQRRALDELLPRFGIPFAPAPIDFEREYGRRAPRVLEIGFGMGETTAAIALARPADDFLGVEVHAPGVGSLLKRVAELGLTNVRVIQHDVVEVVAAMIPPASLAGVHVFFPDPWPKKRHHKRRLLTPGFVHELALRLAAGGCLHVATDWEDYAQEILATLAAEPLLENLAPGFAPRPDYRPLTKFETRGTEARPRGPGRGLPPALADHGRDGRRPPVFIRSTNSRHFQTQDRCNSSISRARSKASVSA